MLFSFIGKVVQDRQVLVYFLCALPCRFNVNDSPGSYFYHGHQMSQRGDGLAGPLIIESTEENAKDATWDKEFNVVIQDWYQEHGGESNDRTRD